MPTNATEDKSEGKAWECANLDVAKITSVPVLILGPSVTLANWVEVRSDELAPFPELTSFVDVERVKSYRQTVDHTTNLDRTVHGCLFEDDPSVNFSFQHDDRLLRQILAIAEGPQANWTFPRRKYN